SRRTSRGGRRTRTRSAISSLTSATTIASTKTQRKTEPYSPPFTAGSWVFELKSPAVNGMLNSQHARPVDATVLKIRQRFVRLFERIRFHVRSHAGIGSFAQQVSPIFPRVGCHRMDVALLEQQLVIIHRWNGRHVNPRQR